MAERRRIFVFLIAALLLLAALLGVVTFVPLRRARDAWRTGRVGESIEMAQSWSRFQLWPRQYHQLLAVAFLSIGRRGDAEPHLSALRGGTQWVSLFPKSEVANKLFGRSRYAEYLDYDASLRPLFGDDDDALYRAAAQLALKRVDEASATAKTIDRGDVDPAKLAAFDAALAARSSGIFPVVVDRHGAPIAAYVFANDDIVALNTDFAPLIEQEAGALTFERSIGHRAGDRIETTLDARTQHAALAALAGFRASLVAIDPRTNEILAIASNRAQGPLANLALEQQYEPGSIVKVLTGMTALSRGVDVAKMFPYHCSGSLAIDGRSFGDWLPDGHGDLPDLDEALAESCNVVFADLGLRAGRDALRATMTRAGFDGSVDLGLFRAPLGRTVGDVFNDFETGFYAIGLEHETTTTLHVAMLASMMANRGVLTTPRLLTARRSILGETVGRPAAQTKVEVAPRAAAQRMVQAMQAVVTRPEGTGRRAQIDGLSLALKTGTAGKREDGYHAVILAFAPVDKPEIAIGIVAEAAGPAEYAGAKIARDFLAAYNSQ
ncbi:MAG TPA: penicillin-binding transpeptidase domain-containing protein [Thermoanaerobaculia bacterium]|nr:penicillin-binding transpeptidase domain-containing protein [Thermoanaerobaculia bacterium]